MGLKCVANIGRLKKVYHKNPKPHHGTLPVLTKKPPIQKCYQKKRQTLPKKDHFFYQIKPQTLEKTHFSCQKTPGPKYLPVPRFNVAPRVGDMDLHASVGLWTPMLGFGPLSWSYGLPAFGVAPCVGDMDSHASMWPLELGICTPAPQWGYGLPRFGMALQIGDMDSQALV